MNKSTLHLSVLLAGLLAVAGVQAQGTSASGSSNLPPKAGEASTQAQGVPNAATTNAAASQAPAATNDTPHQQEVPPSASATTPVPAQAGEATTAAQGKPNAEPMHPMALSRAEVRHELLARRSMFEAARRGTHMMGANAAPAEAPAQGATK